eukprot:Hpha_TRINITY_DN23286_c0_g1::TRINITY_DN23286_c0_g1_i1::g.30289::m.30289
MASDLVARCLSEFSRLEPAIVVAVCEQLSHDEAGVREALKALCARPREGQSTSEVARRLRDRDRERQARAAPAGHARMTSPTPPADAALGGTASARSTPSGSPPASDDEDARPPGAEHEGVVGGGTHPTGDLQYQPGDPSAPRVEWTLREGKLLRRDVGGRWYRVYRLEYVVSQRRFYEHSAPAGRSGRRCEPSRKDVELPARESTTMLSRLRAMAMKVGIPFEIVTEPARPRDPGGSPAGTPPSSSSEEECVNYSDSSSSSSGELQIGPDTPPTAAAPAGPKFSRGLPRRSGRSSTDSGFSVNSDTLTGAAAASQRRGNEAAAAAAPSTTPAIPRVPSGSRLNAGASPSSHPSPPEPQVAPQRPRRVSEVLRIAHDQRNASETAIGAPALPDRDSLERDVRQRRHREREHPHSGLPPATSPQAPPREASRRGEQPRGDQPRGELPAPDTVMVIAHGGGGDGANFHPQKGRAALGRIRNGEQVVVCEVTGVWTRISWRERTGWVKLRHLQRTAQQDRRALPTGDGRRREERRRRSSTEPEEKRRERRTVATGGQQRPPQEALPAVTPQPPRRRTEDKEKDSSMECCVCLGAPKDTLLLPCRHLCLCSGCAEQCSFCPLCRTNVTQRMQVFV